MGDAPIDTDPLRVEVPPTQRQVFVKTVPPGTGRKSLEAVSRTAQLETEAADKQLFKRVPGFQYLALTEPAVKKSFHRVGWAQYADGVDVKDVVTKLDNSKVRREGSRALLKLTNRWTISLSISESTAPRSWVVCA